MSQAGARQRAAPFVTGSTMRHVVVMTLTGAVGLMALFMVDLVDLFFLSLLDNTEVTDTKQFGQLVTKAEKSRAVSVLVRRGEWVNYLVIRPAR